MISTTASCHLLELHMTACAFHGLLFTISLVQCSPPIPRTCPTVQVPLPNPYTIFPLDPPPPPLSSSLR